MTNNTGLDFFKGSENFLTELSDLESEYVSGGGKRKNRSSKTSKTSKTSRSHY